MMNRDRIGFWVKLLSVVLAVFFIGSFVFTGLGSNINYNIFDLIGNQDQKQKQANQSPDPQAEIEQAEKDLKKDPKDPEKIKNLAALYYNAGRYDDAARVLRDGRDATPKDEEILTFLGQVYLQQSQTVLGEKQKALQKKAGDAFAAATEVEPDDAEAYLRAGVAYEQAGEPAQAIKYYNGYLDREPHGENAGKVKDRISALLEGQESTSSAQP